MITHFECSKVKFRTETDADLHIAKLKRTSNRSKIPKRSYLCEHCNSWHLTSTDKNEDTWREKYKKEIKRLGSIILSLQNEIKNKKETIKKLETIIHQKTKK